MTVGPIDTKIIINLITTTITTSAMIVVQEKGALFMTFT